jgi:2-dehydropantoate 2-reductase
MLARRGHHVTLVGRPDQVEAITKNGLTMTGALGQFVVNVAAQTRLDFKPDLLFLTVKAQDVKSACQQIQTWVKDIPVVMMQNGISLDNLAASYFGVQWVVGCVVLFNARYLEPGHVHCGFSGHLILPDSTSDNSQAVATVYNLLNTLFPCQLVAHFGAARWTKLIINAMGNGIEAISGLSLSQCSQHPVLAKVAVLIVREGLRILKSEGIPLQRLPGFPMKKLSRLVRLPLVLAAWVLRKKWTKSRVEDVISSTLQSLRRGKNTEIDYLNGEIVRSGSDLNIPTPVNAQVVAWVHRIEQSGTFISLKEIEQTLFNK